MFGQMTHAQCVLSVCICIMYVLVSADLVFQQRVRVTIVSVLRTTRVANPVFVPKKSSVSDEQGRTGMLAHTGQLLSGADVRTVFIASF